MQLRGHHGGWLLQQGALAGVRPVPMPQLQDRVGPVQERAAVGRYRAEVPECVPRRGEHHIQVLQRGIGREELVLVLAILDPVPVAEILGVSLPQLLVAQGGHRDVLEAAGRHVVEVELGSVMLLKRTEGRHRRYELILSAKLNFR